MASKVVSYNAIFFSFLLNVHKFIYFKAILLDRCVYAYCTHKSNEALNSSYLKTRTNINKKKNFINYIANFTFYTMAIWACILCAAHKI